MISMKKTVMGAALALAFSAGAAQAAYTPKVTTTGNNFTMTAATGGLTGGTNDVTFSWDWTLRSAVVTDGSYNATLSSPSAFNGKIWTAHNVNLYGPGTYTFDTSCASGNPSCGSGTAAQKYIMTVGAGQIGAHMLFDWSTNANIDVVNVWNVKGGAPSLTWTAFNTSGTYNSAAYSNAMQQGSVLSAPVSTTTTMTLNPLHTVRTTTTTYGAGTATPGVVYTELQGVTGYNSVSNPLGTLTGSPTSTVLSAGGCNFTATNTPSLMPSSCIYNTAAKKYNGISIDTNMDLDPYAGTKMVDGPFLGQSANFNVTGVPVPAAAWLLGSGLLGLVGVARRKAA